MSNCALKYKRSLRKCETNKKIEGENERGFERAHGLADVEKLNLAEKLAKSLGECGKLREEIVMLSDREKKADEHFSMMIDGKDNQISYLNEQIAS